MKKYEIVKEQSTFIDGHKVFRIRALKDFDDVRKGSLGGYVESYDNLSQDGRCWLYDDSMTYAEAMVFDDAKIHNNSIVNKQAIVYENAAIYDNCEITDHSQVCGNAHIFHNSKILGSSKIESGVICNDSVISNAVIYVPDIKISKDAQILSNRDYIYLKDFGTSVGSITIFKTSNNNVRINTDQWSGTPEEFLVEMCNVCLVDDDTMEEYNLLVQLIKCHFKLS